MTDGESSSRVSRRTFVASVMGAIGAVGVATALPSEALADEPRAAQNAPAFFLRASGITGDELANRLYVGWIPVLSWSWDTVSTTAGPLTFKTRNGQQTAALLAKAFTRSTLATVELAGIVTPSTREVMRITLTNAIVTKAAVESSTTEMEAWSLSSYRTVKVEMRSGSTVNSEEFTWNTVTGLVA